MNFVFLTKVILTTKENIIYIYIYSLKAIINCNSFIIYILTPISLNLPIYFRKGEFQSIINH
jgi:hypothetical protein